jgi:hypothetical protein
MPILLADFVVVDGHCHTNLFYWSLLTAVPEPDLTIPMP